MVFVLSDFAKKQADDLFYNVVPSLSDDEVLDLYSSLVGNSSFFQDQLSSLVDVRKLRTIIQSEFNKIRKEPMDYWGEITSTLSHFYKKAILPKLKSKVDDLKKNNKVSLSQVLESLIKNSDEF